MKYTKTITGIVNQTFICDLAGTIASRPTPSIQVDPAGIVGDRHFGFTFPSNGRYPYPRGTEIRNSRQVSIVSSEELAVIAQDIDVPHLAPEWLGANLVVSGLHCITLLPPSSRIIFTQGVVMINHGENDPCTGPGDLIQKNYPGRKNLSPAFVKAAMHKRGLVAWVEKAGVITSGEQFTIEIPEQFDYLKILQQQARQS